MVKVSDYIMNFIAGLGVKHVFMVPGGGAMHLDDSLGRCREIEFVCNLHEQAAAIAAEAYAKATDNLGVALVTTGPGGTNAVTGVAGAWLDSTPCLFISGQAKRSDLIGTTGVRQMGVQEVDITSIVKAITKYAVTVMDPAQIRYHLEKGVHLARSGRPGPVWIDVPLDVQASLIDPESLVGYDSRESALPPQDGVELREQAARTIEWLNAAERPVLLAGNGIRLAGARGDFMKLVEELGIPVLTTWMTFDLIPDSHELFIGRPGSMAPRGANFALQNSDFLLSIGARLDFSLTGYAPDKFARAARKVMADIDPAEIGKIAGIIDLPVCSDAGCFMREILRQSGDIRRKDRSTWLKRCTEWKQKYPVVLPEHRKLKEGVSTYYFTEVLSEELSPDEMVVPGSSGVAVEIFLLAFKSKNGQRVFNTAALGAMGFGLPAAIGGCLAAGRKRVVSVDGDGGFQLNIQELETVARLQLPIKFFVINNNGYASIRASQQKYFGRRTGSDATCGLSLPSLQRLAPAYGLTTRRIENQVDLRGRIRAVLDTPGPVVCEIMATPDELRTPSLSSAQKADGTMVSKPLEDLWPFLDREEFLSNMIIPALEE